MNNDLKQTPDGRPYVTIWRGDRQLGDMHPDLYAAWLKDDLPSALVATRAGKDSQ